MEPGKGQDMGANGEGRREKGQVESDTLYSSALEMTQQQV
jgi:hypothetical protein